ncbi:MAG TPA: peptide deformylase [bacterium]|nr:peptide deformylase [bacterium]
MLKIITHPNPILRKKSREIKHEEILRADFKKLVKDMAKTMLEKDGVGLAAPQVGKNIRLIVVNSEDGVMAFINPKILKKSWRKKIGEEGCLSLPDIFMLVKRHYGVEVEFLNLEAKKQKIKAKDLLARVFQHEIDHLDGVLFIDKAER